MKKYIMPIVLIFSSMLFMGFADNIRGLFIPSFKFEFKISDSDISYLVLASSLGYIIFQYVGGILIEKFQHKKVYLLGFIVAIVSFLIIYFSRTYLLLIIAMFIFNIGISLISICTNSLMPAVFIGYQAVLMNMTHFCYGLGTTSGQRIGGIMLQEGVGWRELYLLSGAAYGVLFIALLFIKLPGIHVESEKSIISFKEVMKNKLANLFIIAIGFYICAEVSVSYWFVNFLGIRYNFNVDKSSFYLSMFFLLLTIGRLLGGFVVDRVGHIKSLIIFLSTAFALFTIGLVGGKSLIILISAAGLFYSIVFPTFVVTVNNAFKENTSYILGVIMTFSSGVNMVINFFVGYLNDYIGVYRSFFIIPLSLAISIIFTLLVRKELKTRKTFS